MPKVTLPLSEGWVGGATSNSPAPEEVKGQGNQHYDLGSINCCLCLRDTADSSIPPHSLRANSQPLHLPGKGALDGSQSWRRCPCSAAFSKGEKIGYLKIGP